MKPSDIVIPEVPLTFEEELRACAKVAFSRSAREQQTSASYSRGARAYRDTMQGALDDVYHRITTERAKRSAELSRKSREFGQFLSAMADMEASHREYYEAQVQVAKEVKAGLEAGTIRYFSSMDDLREFLEACALDHNLEYGNVTKH